MRLEERPAKRALRLEAKDLASSETLLKRSDPLTFVRRHENGTEETYI